MNAAQQKALETPFWTGGDAIVDGLSATLDECMQKTFGRDDTSDAGWARYVELLRKRSAAERGAILCGLVSAVRRLAESSIRSQHPGATEREVRARITARIYGPELSRRYFPGANIE